MKRTSDPHQIKEENKKKKKIIFCFPRVGWAEWHRVLVWRPCTYNVYHRLGSSASILRGCPLPWSTEWMWDFLVCGCSCSDFCVCCPKSKKKKSSPSQVNDENSWLSPTLFFVFLLLPLLRLVSRSSILRSRSRFCLRSAMQVDRLIFLLFLFFSLLPFYSALIPLLIPLLIPWDGCATCPCFQTLYLSIASPLLYLVPENENEAPHVQNLPKPGGGGALDGRKEKKKQVA